MVVMRRQLHQTIEHVHDCHHVEHLVFTIGLMFVVLFDEWLRAWP